MKIVLDANILVSSFLTPQGESFSVLQQAPKHKLYSSTYILSEVWRTLHSERLRKKYQYSDSAIQGYLKNLALVSNIVEPKCILEACPDPDDNAVLACAVESNAEYLITRNTKDFPESFEGVSIIQPNEFLKMVRSDPK